MHIYMHIYTYIYIYIHIYIYECIYTYIFWSEIANPLMASLRNFRAGILSVSSRIMNNVNHQN